MDTDTVDKFNEVWARIAEIEKKDAVREFKVKLNNDDIKKLTKEFDEHIEHKVQASIDLVNGKKDRKTNIKIALIGAAAIIIPSLIAIFFTNK